MFLRILRSALSSIFFCLDVGSAKLGLSISLNSRFFKRGKGVPYSFELIYLVPVELLYIRYWIFLKTFKTKK